MLHFLLGACAFSVLSVNRLTIKANGSKTSAGKKRGTLASCGRVSGMSVSSDPFNAIRFLAAGMPFGDMSAGIRSRNDVGLLQSKIKRLLFHHFRGKWFKRQLILSCWHVPIWKISHFQQGSQHFSLSSPDLFTIDLHNFGAAHEFCEFHLITSATTLFAGNESDPSTVGWSVQVFQLNLNVSEWRPFILIWNLWKLSTSMWLTAQVASIDYL